MSMSTGSKNSEQQTQKPSSIVASRATGLDLRSLDNAVKQYFSASIAPSTKRVYDSGKEILSILQAAFNPTVTSSRELIVQICILFSSKQIVINYNKVYLASVRQLHISQGLPAPPTGEMAKLNQVL